MNKSSRCAAVIVSGSALALAGAMLPARAASTGWRISATYSVKASTNVLTSVDAVSQGDAWEVGLAVKNNSNTASPQTVIRHWGGKRWSAVTLPATVAKAWRKQEPLFSFVGASSPKDVWIFGSFAGGYLRLNGTHWTTGKLPGNSRTSGAFVSIDATRVFSSSNVWAFGSIEKTTATQDTTTPYAAHFNGHKWSRQTVPGTSAITAISVVSASSIWALEGTAGFGTNPGSSTGPAQPIVLHWTATSGWQQAAQQPTLPAGGQLTSLAAGPAGSLIAGGSAPNAAKGTTPLTAKWNGSTWSVASLPGAATSADWGVATMVADGTGGLWATASAANRGTERLWHLHGSTWSQVSPAFGKHAWVLIGLALVPHTHSVWAVGALKHGSSADGLIAIDGPTPR
jgi:hypothetical protein